MENARKKKTVKRIIIIVVILALIGAVVGGIFGLKMARNIAAGSSKADARPAKINDDPKFLNVALYPYVPNLEMMEQLASDMFCEIEPDVTLNFVDWDCYISNSPENIDVFMYDALFLDALYENGYLSELDLSGIDNADDIKKFILDETCIWEGEKKKVVGIPNFLCSDFLFYREGDNEIAACENMGDLYAVIGEGEYGKNSGLLINLISNYPYYYLEAVRDDKDAANRDVYAQMKTGNKQARHSLEMMREMIGDKEASQSQLSIWLNGSFEKADRFGKGYGRAYIGYSEALSSMEKDIENIELKFLSFGDGPNAAMFYTDLISINTSVTSAEKRSYCEELVNLLSSHDFVFRVGDSNGHPSYILPARDSVYIDLLQKYPKYGDLFEMINQADTHISRYGPWLFDYSNALYDELADCID